MCLNPEPGYSNMLAEPRITAGIVEDDMQAMQTPFLENLGANDAGDPRLGTPTGLAECWDPPTSAASLKLSGRAGASPHQKCGCSS
jgi:hypothetical protein